MLDLLYKWVLKSMFRVGGRSHSGRWGNCVTCASCLQAAPRMKVDVIFHIYAGWSKDKCFLIKAIKRSRSKTAGAFEAVCSLQLACVCFSFPMDSRLCGLGVVLFYHAWRCLLSFLLHSFILPCQPLLVSSDGCFIWVCLYRAPLQKLLDMPSLCGPSFLESTKNEPW